MIPLRVELRSLFGVASIAAAAVLNPWTVGWVATTDGSIDQINIFAVLLLAGAWLLLGGVQLLWRWVELVSWVRPVGFLRGAVFVSIAATAIAGTHWQIAFYDQAHQHTHVRPADIAEATPEQHAWAEDFYRRSLAAALKHGWFDFDKAMAQGFQPDRVNHTHFPNLEYMFDDVILDPERPEWLVYDETPDGKVLMALMFFTRTLDEIGPTPGGPLALWHRHPYTTPYCAVNGLWTIGPVDRNGRCAEGIPVMRTPEMFHVWFIDHPLGRFTEMKIVPEYWQESDFDLRLLHPIVVHFTIALFIVAVLLDIAGVVLRKPGLHAVAWVNLALAAIAAIATVSAGMTAETLVAITPQAHETLDIHKLLGFYSLGAILLLFTWRYALRGAFPRRGALLYTVISLTGVGVVSGAGYYGGEMVYRHGAAVRATDTFLRERYWKQVREIYRKPSPSMFDQVATGASVLLP
jgi:uncharacterized membrane protein